MNWTAAAKATAVLAGVIGILFGVLVAIALVPPLVMAGAIVLCVLAIAWGALYHSFVEEGPD